MRALLKKPFFRKYGKKALIIYLCLSVIKGILFFLLWYQLFS
jgi:hypothetical protein